MSEILKSPTPKTLKTNLLKKAGSMLLGKAQQEMQQPKPEQEMRPFEKITNNAWLAIFATRTLDASKNVASAYSSWETARPLIEAESTKGSVLISHTKKTLQFANDLFAASDYSAVETDKIGLYVENWKSFANPDGSKVPGATWPNTIGAIGVVAYSNGEVVADRLVYGSEIKEMSAELTDGFTNLSADICQEAQEQVFTWMPERRPASRDHGINR